ncbi:hypothetical protein ACFYUJ_20995 [Streptomyces sp. NPDC004520]|uniref:hypothetical protein n=1 Tax=Streptomyces sp. NPDC004520 TaxID=3364702 RepID=UPI00367DE8FA
MRIADIKVERVPRIPCDVTMLLDRSGTQPVLWVRTDVPESIVKQVLEAAQLEGPQALHAQS